MKRIKPLHRKPLLLALTLTAAAAGTAAAQAPSAGAPPANPAMAGTARPSSAVPVRGDSADAAWQKLGSKGYVTKDDVKDVTGFSFDAADGNHDGRLTQDEFRRAWASYAAGGGGPSSSGVGAPK